MLKVCEICQRPKMQLNGDFVEHCWGKYNWACQATHIKLLQAKVEWFREIAKPYLCQVPGCDNRYSLVIGWTKKETPHALCNEHSYGSWADAAYTEANATLALRHTEEGLGDQDAD